MLLVYYSSMAFFVLIDGRLTGMFYWIASLKANPSSNSSTDCENWWCKLEVMSLWHLSLHLFHLQSWLSLCVFPNSVWYLYFLSLSNNTWSSAILPNNRESMEKPFIDALQTSLYHIPLSFGEFLIKPLFRNLLMQSSHMNQL